MESPHTTEACFRSAVDEKAQFQVGQLTDAVVALKESVQLKVDRLREQIAQRDETIRRLRLELTECSDYELVKERLFRVQEHLKARSCSLKQQVDDYDDENPVDLSIRVKKTCPNSMAAGELQDGQLQPNKMHCTISQQKKKQHLLQHSLIHNGSAVNELGFATADCLDTGRIARKVRDILSTHGIGQRLFARHVLGLSQGTVSELLSKPKPWPKLTEKGRESYRKMACWAASEGNVVALKELLPARKFLTKTAGNNSGRNEHRPLFRYVSPQPLQPPPSLVPSPCSTSNSEAAAATATEVREAEDNVVQPSYWDYYNEILSLNQCLTSEIPSVSKPRSILPASGHESLVRMPPKRAHSTWTADACAGSIQAADSCKMNVNESDSEARDRCDQTDTDEAVFAQLLDDAQQHQPPKDSQTPAVLTLAQKTAMKELLSQNPCSMQIESLAEAFQLPVKSVANWFHNRRTCSRHRAGWHEQRQIMTTQKGHSTTLATVIQSFGLKEDHQEQQQQVPIKTSQSSVSKRKSSRPKRLQFLSADTTADSS